MGRHSDSDDSHKKTKERSRHRSRSSSPHGSESSHRSKHKHKKKSRKRRDRSSSSQRKLSRSHDRRRSRSRSGNRRSRRERGRSNDRRRSRSRSNERRRASRSRSRSTKRSHRSRSSSPQSNVGHYARSSSRSRQSISDSRTGTPQMDNTGTFETFPSYAEQTESKLQMAIRAAAAADEKLRQNVPSGLQLTVAEIQQRSRLIEDIEGDSFVQEVFISNRQQKLPLQNQGPSKNSHEEAIFGNGLLVDSSILTSVAPRKEDPNSFMHPNLYVPAEEKMDRWIKKLTAMRQRKLQSDVVT